MRRVLAWLQENADVRDAHVYGGLVLAAVGGCFLSVPVTLIVVGVAAMALGVFGPRRVS